MKDEYLSWHKSNLPPNYYTFPGAHFEVRAINGDLKVVAFILPIKVNYIQTFLPDESFYFRSYERKFLCQLAEEYNIPSYIVWYDKGFDSFKVWEVKRNKKSIIELSNTDYVEFLSSLGKSKQEMIRKWYKEEKYDRKQLREIFSVPAPFVTQNIKDLEEKKKIVRDEKIMIFHSEGYSMRKIAKELKISRDTVDRIIKKNEVRQL